jgi:hypothetical protein
MHENVLEKIEMEMLKSGLKDNGASAELNDFG